MWEIQILIKKGLNTIFIGQDTNFQNVKSVLPKVGVLVGGWGFPT